MCQLDQLEAAAAGVQLAHLLANAVNEGIEEFLIQPSTNELQAAQAFLQIQVSSKSLWQGSYIPLLLAKTTRDLRQNFLWNVKVVSERKKALDFMVVFVFVLAHQQAYSM